MAAPQKPWEKVGVNNQTANTTFLNEMSGTLDTPINSTMATRPPCCSPNAPPIPTRPTQSSGYGGTLGSGSLGGYGSGMGGYGMGMGGYGYGGGMSSMYGGGMYGGGMYGGGMYGGGYNRFNQQDNNTTNSFVQQAENSSRQAFQSVESVVQAFGSIAMMMDSTFYAVTNSFRAILGVADQFSRAKTHITQIFSALAVIKTLRYLFRKLLVLLRLRQKGLPEDVWNAAVEDGMKAVLSEQDLKSGGGGSSWPILLFFAIVIGGPWLLWKLLASVTGGATTTNWQTGDGEHYVAKADYDYTSQTDEELSFKTGQKIIIAPKDMQPNIRGWLMASINEKMGLIPANYVKILGKRKGKMNVKLTEPLSKVTEESSFATVPGLPRRAEVGSLPSHMNTSTVGNTQSSGCCDSKPALPTSGCCGNKSALSRGDGCESKSSPQSTECCQKKAAAPPNQMDLESVFSCEDSFLDKP